MAFAKKLFFTALFLSLLMESQSTSTDPWFGVAWYFHADLKSWLPEISLPFNPLEIGIMLILFIYALRGRQDRRYHFERGLLFWPMIGLGAILAYGLLWGFVQSGSDLTTALFEVRALAYCIIAYFLVGILFTQRRDLDTLTWIILLSNLLLAVECIIRYFFFEPGHVVGDLDYDHEDATLLSFAILLSGAILLLGGTRRQKWFALASIPVDLIAIMVTHRRAGFAALLTGVIFLVIILFRVNRPLFFKIVPVTVLALGLYVAAYSNCSYGTLCQPARAIISQFNPNLRDQQSDQYRAIEKVDLTLNIQTHPLTGVGFGQPFIFYIQLPDESFWPFWHFTPHNEILWIWLDLGIVSFMVFWWLVGSGIYRGGRLIQALSVAGDKNARALLTASVCLIAMQIAVSYVDLGLTSDRTMLLLGVVFGVIGHLPGILRRSANIDLALRPGKRGATWFQKAQPEVQAGVLARVLITPVEEETTHRSLTSPRPYSHNQRDQSDPTRDQSSPAARARQPSDTLREEAPAAPKKPAVTAANWLKRLEEE